MKFPICSADSLWSSIKGTKLTKKTALEWYEQQFPIQLASNRKWRKYYEVIHSFRRRDGSIDGLQFQKFSLGTLLELFQQFFQVFILHCRDNFCLELELHNAFSFDHTSRNSSYIFIPCKYSWREAASFLSKPVWITSSSKSIGAKGLTSIWLFSELPEF